MAQQADLFLIPDVVSVAAAHRSSFSDEFIQWLPNNMHVWSAFEAEAFKVIRRGFEHYSGRTIIEFLRHHTALQETPAPGQDFKINNNYPPYLVRLFDLVHPEHKGLFEYRETKKVTSQAASS